MPTTLPHAWGEARVVALLIEGRAMEAAEALIGWMKPEVLAYLRATLRDEARAEAACAQFQVEVLQRIQRWDRAGSLRLWALGLARAAAHRTPPQPASVPSRPCIDDEGDELSQVMTAMSFLERLSPDDQLLLLLRVGRGLPWNEVVDAFANQGRSIDEATLRARFDELKAFIAVELPAAGRDGDGHD